jgi:hypothetical protein
LQKGVSDRSAFFINRKHFSGIGAPKRPPIKNILSGT